MITSDDIGLRGLVMGPGLRSLGVVGGKKGQDALAPGRARYRWPAEEEVTGGCVS